MTGEYRYQHPLAALKEKIWKLITQTRGIKLKENEMTDNLNQYRKEVKEGSRYLRSVNRKIELITRLLEVAPMKIYRVDYFVKAKTDGHQGWTEISGDISVAAATVERAIEAAKRHALASITFYNDEVKKKETERYADFELKEVKLVAESDIRG